MKKKILARRKTKLSTTRIVAKPVPSESSAIKERLNAWAHDGTIAGLDKLDEFIRREENKELRAHAKLARGEAAFAYYVPQDKNEESQVLLVKMTRREEERLFALIPKRDAAELELKRLELEAKVHDRLMRNKKYDKDKRADWQYRFSPDYAAMVKNRLADLENDIAYMAAWIDEAHRSITVDRYQNIPPDILDSLYLDGEGETFWADEPLSEDDHADEGKDDFGASDRDDWKDEIKIENIPF